MVRGQQVQLGPSFVGLQALDVFNSVGHHHVLVYLLSFQTFCKLFWSLANSVNIFGSLQNTFPVQGHPTAPLCLFVKVRLD
jgi:hypothetical protein